MKKYQANAGKIYTKNHLTLAKNHRFVFLDADDLVDALGIAPRTARRFIKEPEKLPRHHRELLEYKCLGIVPGMPEATCKNGEIWVDSKQKFGIEQLRGITLLFETVRALRADLSEIAAENEQLRAALTRFDNVVPIREQLTA